MKVSATGLYGADGLVDAEEAGSLDPDSEHSCATGAAGRYAAPRPPHPIDLAVDWRGYQEFAVAALLRAAEAGARRLHLVAPPGAGKTQMGLYVAMALGRPVVVLCHTRAIAAQWLGAFRDQAFDLEGVFGGDVAARASQALPEAETPLPLLLVTTYQAFTRQRPAQLQRSDSAAERLAPTVLVLHQRVAQAGALLVLDECHHLTAFWAEALAGLVAGGDDVAVLGLTATPPEDASAEARRRVADLVGDVTYEIPLVGAVREGALAPFQDLCVFVRPGVEAVAAIAGADGALVRWLAAVAEGVDTGGGWLVGLRAHVRHRLTLTPGRRSRAFDDVLALCDAEPDFVTALARYLHAAGEELPAEVAPTWAMERRPTRDDLLAIVDDYLAAVLAPAAAAIGGGVEAMAASAQAHIDGLRAALAPLDVQVHGAALRGGEDGGQLGAALAASRSRIDGMVHVLRLEQALLGAGLCAAVICDFATSDAGDRGGRQEDDASFVPGAIGAFRAIAADPELAALAPILATGEVKWLPAALGSLLALRLGPLSVGLLLAALRPERVGTDHVAYVEATLPGHEGALLRALTGLLEHDHAHCVVGTRALLDEAWDCQALDTFIDLTAARSSVAVNQWRGRVLRLRDDRPERLAHFWDIVAVPAVVGASGLGLEDLRRFLAKHERYHAPAADGALERGAGHVSPFLRGGAEEVAGRVEAAGAALWAQAHDRQAARTRWRLGVPVGDAELLELRCVGAPAAGARESAVSNAVAPHAAAAAVLRAALPGAAAAEWTRRWRARRALRPALLAAIACALGLIGCGAGLAAFGDGAVGGGALAAAIAGATLGVIAGGAVAWQDGALRRLQAQGPAALAAALVEIAVAAAGVSGRKLAAVRVRRLADAEGARWALEGADGAARRRLALVVEQTLMGCPAPVYALVVMGRQPVPGLWARGEAPFRALGLVAVPSALGAGRTAAEAFAAGWRARLGPCELRATRPARAHDEMLAAPLGERRWLLVAAGTLEVRDLRSDDQ